MSKKRKRKKYEGIKRSKLIEGYRYPKKKRKKRTTAWILRNIPVDLRDQFKAWCSERGYTMTGRVRDLMRMTLNGDLDDL